MNTYFVVGIVAFIAGALIVLWMTDTNWLRGFERFLTIVQGSRTHLVNTVIVLVILQRTYRLPDSMWTDVMNGGQLIWLPVAAGGLLLASKAGAGIRDGLRKRATGIIEETAAQK